MKKSYTLVVILLSILLGCSEDEVNTTPDSNISNTSSNTIMHVGVNREYLVYIPSSYNQTYSAPLMLNFHGFGGNSSDFMNYADMRTLAESDTFILVYPQGSLSNGFSHWNPCPIGGDNKSTADDFGFIEAMVQEIASQYNVDLDRIYAAGYSNGGMMAYGLANYKSELVSAVASVSGAMLDCIGTTNHPMPVLHLHGTNDDVIPYDGDSYYGSAQSTIDHWVNFNSTNTNPVVSIDDAEGRTIEQFVYDQGDSNVSVEHYKYINGGHNWFNSKFKDQSTSELIWNFVSRYDINGLR